MNSETQYNKIELSCDDLYFTPSNVCNIWVRCKECKEKNPDDITMKCEPKDLRYDYFIFQCDEARKKKNDNLKHYDEIIHAFAELLDEKKESSSYSD